MTKIDRQTAFSGTKDVAAPLRFDTAQLEAYLDRPCARLCRPAHGPAVQGRAVEPDLFARDAARRYVLRRKPPGKLLPSAHAVDREYRVISALHGAGFPVAEPLRLLRGRERRRHAVLRDGLCRRPRDLGAAYAGLPTRPSGPPIFDVMNATLAQLHSFDPAPIGLGSFGKGENYVARQVDRWSKQYRASRDRDRSTRWSS